MSKFKQNLRFIILLFAIVGALSLSLLRLMKIQIVEGEELLKQSVRRTVGIQEIVAPRGEIVDINGNPIVKNEAGFSVIIEAAFFSDDLQKQNQIILEVVNILKDCGDEWIDNMPITNESPFEFEEEKDSAIKKMKENLRLNTYATAQNCIDKIIDEFEISDEYSIDEKRVIAGVRYQMIENQFSVSNRYTLAVKISNESLAKIKELSFNLEGVDVVEEPIRVYVDGTILPHAIGTVGPIYAEEYMVLKEEGYRLNDKIGKSGIEKAMEDVLRGINGSNKTTISSDKEIVEVVQNEPTIAGSTVQLTIDAQFQKKCQAILADTIAKLNAQPDSKYSRGRDARAGSIVVLDAKTGAVRALASFPEYDINDYISNYSEVAKGENNPLINRATDGLYRPGSTFKPISAFVALNEGIVTPETEIYCGGSYNYLGTIMNCHNHAGHGSINVVTAIQESCNIFFYEVSQQIGIDKLEEYEKLFGLGVSSDLEIGSALGYLATPETHDSLGVPWTPGQLLQASIGQSEVLVTPLQMATEALTLANHGKRYSPYLIDSIWDYNHTEEISCTEPKLESTIQDKTGTAFDAVIEGMKGAAKNTYGVSGLFSYEEYSLNTLPYETAIKTGSPQVTKEVTDSAFIGFYPAHDPEIVFAGYLERGEYSKYMIRKIIDAYYGYDEEVSTGEDVQNKQILEN